MSFLSRHRSIRPLQDTANYEDSAKPTPSSWRGTDRSTLGTTSGIRKRLSSFSLLVSKRPTSPQPGFEGIGYQAKDAVYRRPRSRSPSPAPSLTIRRPSGLGRRVSQGGQPKQSDSPTTRVPTRRRPVPGVVERKHSISAPDLSLNFEELYRWDVTSQSEEEDSEAPPPASFDFTRIPAELLKTIFSHAHRRDLPSLALICRSFSAPVRSVLFGNLDLRDVKDYSRVESCVALLASRRDLAALVRTFACRTVPTLQEYQGTNSLSTVTFAIALTNMHQLQSLILPRFDAHFLFHTTFRLKRLTLLCESVTDTEYRDLLAWFVSQTALTSLSLPNLALKSFTYDGTCNSGSGSLDNNRTSDGMPTPFLQNKPDTNTHSTLSHVLRQLTHFHGPASLATALVPGRPVHSASLFIHTTLYDGLRPSAVMGALARSSVPIKHLAIVASSKDRVDPRTLERVLMSAGAELGSSVEVLEVDWVLEDEILYKQILAVLPRFRALRTLRLHRRSPPPPPRSPPPSLPLPSTSSGPQASPSSFLANSKMFSYSPPASPTPSTRGRGNTAKQFPLDVPLPRAHERTHLAAWNRQCTSLKTVVFLSGAEWRVGTSMLEGLGTPLFTYVGSTRA